MEFQCHWETLGDSVDYASDHTTQRAMDMSYYLQTTINYLLKDDEMNISSSALQSLLIYESMDSESQRKPLGRVAGAWGWRSLGQQ